MFHGSQFTPIEFQAWHDSSISVIPGHSIAEVPIPTVLVGREELVIQMRISADLQSDNLFHPFGGITNAPYDRMEFDQMVYDRFVGYELKLN